ncbi:Heavy metal transport/detoxification superfamily protein [Striga hermonthica]|uniref:Heavy metal transport/detoxification superfamily protein n=1 Tax=Striga hermonthica TaxID=68872 RepID=A0A9N7RR04_STRHE|nr:Heavy metal transport/detoxification superfamily protein [Striga hermonthica]
MAGLDLSSANFISHQLHLQRHQPEAAADDEDSGRKQQQQQQHQFSGDNADNVSSGELVARRPRGRPPGSKNKPKPPGEVTVKGAIDAKKVQERLQKWSKKKVELKSETMSKDEVKKETIRTITMKVYLHCDQCEREARKRLMMHKGIHNVKTDIKAQRITVEGVLEPEKLVTYMRKRVHKYAELIVTEKKKEENKEKGKGLEENSKSIVQFKEVNKVEAKNKEGEVAYFIHYVYAPQMFSDENPNACSIL